MKLCHHFGTCGGCALQDISESDYRRRKQEQVASALTRAGVVAPIEEMVSVPPLSRRRASFELAKRDGAVRIGFHARSSHEIVDMQECRVLTPAITALVRQSRTGLGSLLGEGEACDLLVTETDSGFDI